MVPFSKAAVFSPERSLSQPQNPTCDRQMQAEIKAWHLRAQSLGADVTYARVAHAAAGQQMLRSFQELGANIIAPISLFDPQLEARSWQYRSVDLANIDPDIALAARQKAYLGWSCHSTAEVSEALKKGFDYVFLSPIFSTSSHPEATALGLNELREACLVSRVPVLALGGVTFENAQDCLAAGAAGWAGLSCWL